jgi:D-alanyl-D-alanine carboxypeptidase (penicillin-binding protein 5/6)
MKSLVSALLVLSLAVPVLAQEEEAGGAAAKGSAVDTTGKGYTAAYVIDQATQQVLFAENEHTALPTASMAKMMTLLITLEEVRAGNLKWDTPITVSAKASKMGGSQIYQRAGSVRPVKNLVIATMVQSANDAAQALGEKIGGSSEGFADLMNQTAQELGLTHSKFFDPHGLPATDPANNNVMCAHDLAILGAELFKHPLMRDLAKVSEMPFQNGTLAKIYNPNHLINPRSPDYMSDATGIKTGYSGPAGYCITAAASRNGINLISVVMGAKPSRGPLSSFGIAGRLMNEAFAKYRVVTPLKQGAVVGDAAVAKGATKTVQAVASADAGALVKRGEEKSVSVQFNAATLTAPVKKGQPVGTINVQQGGKTIAKIPAVAAADVAPQAWWKSFLPF